MLAPIFGETYKKAQKSDSKEEFIKSREAASTAALYGSTLAGSAIQTYAIAAVLNHCGALSYKGAAYIGGLIFAATSVPPVCLPRSRGEDREANTGGGGISWSLRSSRNADRPSWWLSRLRSALSTRLDCRFS